MPAVNVESKDIELSQWKHTGCESVFDWRHSSGRKGYACAELKDNKYWIKVFETNGECWREYLYRTTESRKRFFRGLIDNNEHIHSEYYRKCLVGAVMRTLHNQDQPPEMREEGQISYGDIIQEV